MSARINLLQITDLHLFADPERRLLGVNTAQSFKAVIEHVKQTIAQYAPQLIVLSGDLSQDDSQASYQYLMAQMSDFSQPIAWLPGNHDQPKLMEKLFNEAGFSQHKHFIFKPWQIILLDSHWDNQVAGRLATEQLAFLDRTLATHPEYALVVLHHHVQPVESQWLDNLKLQNDRDFLGVIAKYPQVRGVISGHVHQDFYCQHQKVSYLTTPSTCIQFKPWSANFNLDNQMPGYRYLSLMHDGHLTTQVYRIAYSSQFLPDMQSQGY